MKNRQELQSHCASEIILFIVAAIWGGGFVAGKLALECYSPLMIVGMRFCSSALLIQMVGLMYTSAMKKSFMAATYIVFTPFVAFLILKTRVQLNDTATPSPPYMV